LEAAYAPPARPEPVLLAEAAPAPEFTPEPEQAPADVPATASPYFALGLIGLLTATAGLAMRKTALRQS
jgi:hypothetical protein